MEPNEMNASLLSAQLSHDFAVPPGTYSPEPETTAAEALRGRLSRACKAGEKFVDTVECEVTEHSDNQCVVEISVWPCEWEDRAKLANALEAMAREIRPFSELS